MAQKLSANFNGSMLVVGILWHGMCLWRCVIGSCLGKIIWNNFQFKKGFYWNNYSLLQGISCHSHSKSIGSNSTCIHELRKAL